MKERWIVSSLMSGAIALSIVSGYAKQQKAEAVNLNAGPAGNEWTQAVAGQEEHKTYKLAADAHIDVFEISGPVSVEATEGSTAKVSIYRTAPNPDNLAYRKVFVEQTPSGLTIRQKNDGTEPDSVDLLNRVVLKVPRQVSVSVKRISGDFNVSGIDGKVDVNSISGSVDAKQLNGALTVSGASGSVRVALERIDDAGLRVSNVSGSIYLKLASDLNAEISVSNTTGAVTSKIEGLTFDKHAANYSARVGLGGPRIVVSNVTGAVVLQRI